MRDRALIFKLKGSFTGEGDVAITTVERFL
jgi:hypothetical protein